MELKRHLGVSYATAWMVTHKLLEVMLERDAERRLGGVIALDDVYWGGECCGQTPGRGSPNKTPLLAAVSKNPEGHSIALHPRVVKRLRKRELAVWAEKSLDPDSSVVRDGLACIRTIAPAGIEHQPVVTDGGADSVELADFTWVNTILGNVNDALQGTYHKASAKHLPRYLAEFC